MSCLRGGDCDLDPVGDCCSLGASAELEGVSQQVRRCLDLCVSEWDVGLWELAGVWMILRRRPFV